MCNERFHRYALNKIRLRLNGQYSDILDGHKDAVPKPIFDYCVEEERARAVYTAALLKNNFPHLFPRRPLRSASTVTLFPESDVQSRYRCHLHATIILFRRASRRQFGD